MWVNAPPSRSDLGKCTGLTTVALLVAVFGAVAAQAQTARLAPHGLAELSYEAPPGCPDRAHFLESAKARLAAGQRATGATLPADARPREVAIRVQSGEHGTTAELVLFSGEQTVARRRIAAATCQEATEALALVLALVLAREAPGPTPAERAVETPRREATTTRSGEVAPRGAAERAAEAPRREHAADGPQHVDPLSGNASDGPARARAPQGTGRAAGDDRVTHTSVGASQRTSTRVAAYLGAGVAIGVLPVLRPAWQASVTLATHIDGPAVLGLRAGFRYAAAHTMTHPNGHATFGWWSGHLGLCAGTRHAGGTTHLWLCLAGEAGRLGATARRTRNPRESHRLWAAGGPGAVVQWDLLPPLSIQVGAEVLWPLARDSYMLGDTTVHRAAVPGVRLDAGIGLHFF